MMSTPTLVTFILGWIAIVLVSRMGDEPGEEVQAEFGRMEEELR